MKQLRRIMWGIVLVVIGVVYALNALEVTDIDIFFKGWWTLFIIVPSFISMITDKNKTVGIIGFVIGLIFLLSARELIDLRMVWKLIVPLIIIVTGLSLIFKDTFNKAARENIKKLKNSGSLRSVSAVFSTQSDECNGQSFTGAQYSAVFGTVNSDLKGAYLERDSLIKVKSIFGSVNITVPDGVNVNVVSNTLFGGVSNRIPSNKANEITIYVEAFCLFGNAEIL